MTENKEQTQPEVESQTTYGTESVETTQAEQEFLDRAFPVDAPKENTAPVRAEDGKFVKQESEQQAAEQAKPKGYDKAIKALKLDGWTDDDVSSLSPERVIALGKKAKDRHSEIGKKLQSQSSQDAEEPQDAGDDSVARSSEVPVNEDADDEPQETTPEPGSAEPTGQPEYNLKAIIKPVSDAIGLGDEVGDALAQALEQALTPLQSELHSYRQAHMEMIAQRGVELGERARQTLQADFPGLKDEAKFEKVVTRMTELAKVKQYESMDLLMRDAAKIELFDDIKTTHSKNHASSRKSMGQPVTQSRTAPAQSLSAQDREDLALDALLAGKGRDAAKAAYFGN